MSKIILLKHSHTKDPKIVEVGVDEAGRGALAGPVTVAACIMPFGFQHELIKDSKLLKEDERVEARKLVLDNCLAYSIQHVNVDEIENTNILKATLEGMRRALAETCQILAKTERDNYMRSLEGGNIYGWGSNKGYGTKQHIKAIKESGATEHHRDSFISHLLTTTNQLF